MKNVQLLTRKSRDKGELPAVMVKKSASRAENMADAIKFARCVQTGSKWVCRQCKRKIVDKSGTSMMAAADSQKQRVLCVRLPVFRFARKAVFAFTRHAIRAAE